MTKHSMVHSVCPWDPGISYKKGFFHGNETSNPTRLGGVGGFLGYDVVIITRWRTINEQ